MVASTKPHIVFTAWADTVFGEQQKLSCKFKWQQKVIAHNRTTRIIKVQTTIKTTPCTNITKIKIALNIFFNENHINIFLLNFIKIKIQDTSFCSIQNMIKKKDEKLQKSKQYKQHSRGRLHTHTQKSPKNQILLLLLLLLLLILIIIIIILIIIII